MFNFLVGSYFISLLILCFISYQNSYPSWRIGLKAFTSLLFVTIAFLCLIKVGFTPGGTLLFSGLFIAAVGDVLLGFADQHTIGYNRLLLAGIIVFGLAHVVFSLCFLTLIPFDLILFIMLPLFITIAFAFTTHNAYFNFRELRSSILCYCLVICIMWLIGLHVPMPAINIGTTLFLISDLLLCFAYFFIKKHPIVRSLNLIFYYIAEILLALSILNF